MTGEQTFYGDDVYARDAAGIPATVWRLDDSFGADDAKWALLRAATMPAPEHGPGVRRGSFTGELFYSARWL